MKKLIKYLFINTYSLYLVSTIAKGLTFSNGLYTLIMAGSALTVGSIVLKPLINLLLLPLNLITFGFFRWVSFSLILYIVSLVVKSFRLSYFYFDGYSNKWIEIPEISLKGIGAYIAFSFILSLFISFIHWLTS